MNIVIATGIYPPEVGGPAQYAENLAHIWRSQGHHVSVPVFSQFNYLPTGLRHIVYFFYILPQVFSADFVLMLDTFSVALPALLVSKIFFKKTAVRVGGDFLWESYVERTKKKILLRDFYTVAPVSFSKKEKIIFLITRWVLRSVDVIIWTTQWQKDISLVPYELSLKHHVVVENFFGPTFDNTSQPTEKVFVGSSRNSLVKNTESLRALFTDPEITSSGITLDTTPVPHDEFIHKIIHSYAVILVSLSDVSPNVILECIRCQKPFILTKETGIYERLKDIAIFVDPLDSQDIKEKILWLSQSENYEKQVQKITKFTFLHTWQDIAREYIDAITHI